MKRFIYIFLIFLFLSLRIITLNVFAQQTRFKKGFYNVKILGLMENVTYTVQNISNYNGFLIVFDSNQKIQQAVSLEPNSQKYTLKAISNDDRVVILGKGEFIFS